MRRLTQASRWLAVLSLSLLIAAACGGDDGSAPAPTPTLEAPGSPVSFTTDDGVTISGYLFGDGDVAVILAHMFPNDQTAWFPFADELADEGFTALTFDFRGYGESGGDQEISEIPRDVGAALDFMQGRGFDDVYFVGASMGGSASLIAAAQHDVAGVVSVSAPQSFQGLEPLEVVADVTEPKLFIASEGDASAASSLELLFEEARDPKERQVFAGSAHGTALLDSEHGREFRDLVIDFLSGGASDDYIP